jgi:hypothetical protein
MGACADTGHWVRSGLDPVASLNKLKGRIIELHFKDLNRRAAQAYDVPWGTGDSDVPGMLAALREQKFQGYFVVEYEKAGPDLVANVKRCIEYFNNARMLDAVQLDSGAALVPGMARNVAQTWSDVKVAPDNNQWMKPQDLFKGDLSNAICKEGSWVFTNDVLEARGDGDIWTKEQYGNFILELEFRCETNTNSGVFLRCADIQNWLHTSIEVQILQPDAPDKKHTCGAIFDCLAPLKPAIKPPGEWNKYKITAKGNRITVELNGEKVNDMDLDRWTEAHKNPDGTPNKFNTAYKNMARTGHIGLQYHGNPIAFRNLTVTLLRGQ